MTFCTGINIIRYIWCKQSMLGRDIVSLLFFKFSVAFNYHLTITKLYHDNVVCFHLYFNKAYLLTASCVVLSVSVSAKDCMLGVGMKRLSLSSNSRLSRSNMSTSLYICWLLHSLKIISKDIIVILRRAHLLRSSHIC